MSFSLCFSLNDIKTYSIRRIAYFIFTRHFYIRCFLLFSQQHSEKVDIITDGETKVQKCHSAGMSMVRGVSGSPGSRIYLLTCVSYFFLPPLSNALSNKKVKKISVWTLRRIVLEDALPCSCLISKRRCTLHEQMVRTDVVTVHSQTLTLQNPSAGLEAQLTAGTAQEESNVGTRCI